MTTTVTTQQDLDAALNAGEPKIIINSPAGVWLQVTSTDSSSVVARGSSSVEARGSSSVVARDSSSVEATDSSSVVAWDSSSVVAWGSSSVVAWDSSSVVARDSSSVVAWGSSSVVARDSSSVVARGSSSVVARGSSSVEARDSSSVVAWGSSSVVAWGSSSVEAWDSSSVEAWDSSSVEAGKYVAVHLHSGRATIEGGVIIDITKLDLESPADWADYHGVQQADGELVVYKAVDDNLKSGRGFAYPIGETVTAPDWNPGDYCGAGLHFSPSPAQARDYHREATRFLKCAVPLTDLSILDGSDTYTTPKLKARSARVLAEVDIHGDEVTR